MSGRFFGTDGVRGRANQGPMMPGAVQRLALAAAAEFQRGGHRHRVVIGKDTRLSGYMLEPALTSGFVAMGWDTILAGPIPTPGVAMLTGSLRADLGVMISASHNPYEDNGIKLFGPDGYKLSDAMEAAIEARMADDQGGAVAGELAAPGALGRAKRLEDVTGRYMEFVKRTLPAGLSLEGLKLAVDCANGAAYRVAPTVLWELGADVVPVAVSPNGKNINAGCGATDTAALQGQVVAHGADLGIALDGDADRLVLVDERGRIVDGDQVMALIAASWQRDGRLQGGGIACTVMSNLGLERHARDLGLSLARTRVGDRHVLEEMRARGFNLGGEQSGHVILSDYATTGDGIVAALQVLAEIQRAQRPASEILHVFEPVPQLMRNVRYAGGEPMALDPVRAAIAAAETRLAAQGRLLVRPSGTEPVIRVMAEADDPALIEEVVGELCAAIERQAGAG